ncbi:HNH endonuclease [Weissella paramesenteroides]|nr:HNH endonuclease [Weissella paramesenteroides]KAA8452765.1 HNH endonuclease [Weissella paramesenteroides]
MAMKPNHYCQQHINHEAEYQAKREQWQAQDNKRRQQHYDRTKRVRDETKQEQVRFYRSKHWKALRQVVLERDHYLCQYCLAKNRMTSANTVDHIVPYEFNQTKQDDVNNLAVICRQCHYGKSKWEREYYGTGTGNELKHVVEIGNVNLLPDFIDSAETPSDEF